MNRLLRFLDLFPAKIQINDDHGTSFKYDNMNTSLVNVNISQWHEGEMDAEWFTITSGRTVILLFLRESIDDCIVLYT